MLYQLSKQLGDALETKGVPFKVVFGPEPTGSVGTRERVVFDVPIGRKGDQLLPPRGIQTNPRRNGTIAQAVVLRIFARSPLASAGWHDHDERAKAVAQAVKTELEKVVRTGMNLISWGGCGYVAPEDEKGPAWSGVVYEIDATITGGIVDVTWAGDKNPEATVGSGGVGIKSTTKASIDGSSQETGCG